MDKRKIKQQKRNKQLYNKIYQFNKKIDKLQNDELISPYLPNKLNYNEYKNMDGRSQRAFINSLTNFTKRGGEKLTENKTTGEVVTNFENKLINKNKGLYKNVKEFNKTSDKKSLNFIAEALKSKKEKSTLNINISDFIDKNTYIKNERGIKITKSEYNNLLEKVNTINEKRRKRKEWVEGLPRMNYKEQVGTLGDKNPIYEDDRLTALRDKKFNFDKMSKLDFEYFKQSVKKQSDSNYWRKHDDQWINNLINGIVNAMGVSEKSNKLIETILSKYYNNPKGTIAFMYRQRDLGDIHYYYNADDSSDALDMMLEVWGDI